MAAELNLPPLVARRVKELAELRRARVRRERGRWLVEGAVLLAEALDAGCAVELVAASEEQAKRHAALLARAAAAGAELARLDARGAARLGDREQGPALHAVVRRPAPWSGALPASGPALVLALCDLQDPGNVGTLLRSARAFGAAAVLLGEQGAEAGNPKVLRASAGAALALPLAGLDALPAALAAGLQPRAALAPSSEEHGGPTRGERSAGGDAPARRAAESPASAGAAALPERLLLLLGHETRGLDAALAALGLADAPAASVPQEPAVESLNVAVAGSILMADWYRSRSRSRA